MLKENPDPTKAGELNDTDLDGVAGGLVAIVTRKQPIPDDGRSIAGTPVPDDGRSIPGLPVPDDGRS